MSLMMDLKAPRSRVGAWARERFPQARALYPLLREAAAPVVVRPVGWADGTDQRWSWSGTACDTMLRWHLGDTGPSGPAQLGAARIVTSMAAAPLRMLLEAAPDLDDTKAASRVAVVWALAEQHYRYGLTENPLTGVADGTEAEILACVPDEVVADVAAIVDGPAAALVAEIGELGPVTAGVEFPYPGGADLDLLAGTAIVEVKTTVGQPGHLDVLQALCYGLLAEPEQADLLVWAFPRSGKTARLALADAVALASGDESVSVAEVRRELRAAAGIV